MPSTVDICNLALMHLGTNTTISSLSEQSPEARACARVFDTARDATLRDHNWNFATRYVSLAAIGNPPQGWQYRYQYPHDCMKAVSLQTEHTNKTQQKPPVFRVVAHENLESRAIICNISPAILEYTAKVTNTENFDPLFIEALSLRLASLMAFTLTGKTRLRSDALKLYDTVLSNARLIDAQEGQSSDMTEPDWITSR